jgi:hypothetical protein
MNQPIKTPYFCPSCKEERKVSRLSYLADSYPVVFCPEKHEFASTEDALAYAALTNGEAVTEEGASEPEIIAPRAVSNSPSALLSPAVRLEEPPKPVKVTLSPPDSVVAHPERAEANTSEWPTDQGEEVPLPSEELSPREVARVSKVIEISGEQEQAAVVVQKSNGKFTPPRAVRLPTGVMVLTVRIPDQHVTGLEAEAANQKETPEVYFQRIVEWGLDSGWFFAV